MSRMLPGSADIARLNRATVRALVLCAALVAFCYFVVDRPVAELVHLRGWSRIALLRWLTDIPPILQLWSPVALVVCLVLRAWGPFGPAARAAVAASLAIILADQFKETLALVFGRTWPETWVDDNPSLLRNGAFGFHPFHGGPGYECFPSGHTARMGAITAALWRASRPLGALGVAATIAVAVGLLGMNYHFVGDVVGGAFVGAIVGTWCAALLDVGRSAEKRPDPAAASVPADKPR